MVYLFIATIGPVQPFIASARRTRDLYAGSTLLSELSKAGAYAIVEHVGSFADLIFPAPTNMHALKPDSPLNVANKIVAIVQQSPEELGKTVYCAILHRLNEIKEDAFAVSVKENALGMIEVAYRNHEAVQAQLENLIEYSWVAVELLDDLSNYQTVREQAEAILGARKNTHSFGAVTWGNRMDKSSIDGQRESVIPAHHYGPRRDRERNARALYDTYKAKPYERLSAVDLLKRLAWGKKEESTQITPLPLMLSTSHIAATPFLARLAEAFAKMSEDDQKKAGKLWSAYLDQAAALAPTTVVERIRDKRMRRHPITEDVDGALLFKERLREDAVREDQLPLAVAALDDFFKFTKDHLDGLDLSPYYAILLADGDGMGKAIDAQTKPDGHRALSQTLATFAGQVQKIVNEKHFGSLVYAGGDDVLALLPLHTVINCAKELANTFHTLMQDSNFNDREGHSPTLSAGIAVVHHISLLQDSLEVARAAERKAKDYHGTEDGRPAKNALAIIVKKRGGEQNETVVSWDDQEARLHFLIQLYNAGMIPKGMAYELRTMMQRLQPSRHDQKNADLQHIVQIEAARILRRKLYFSQDRIAKQDNATLEDILSTHLNSYQIEEKAREKLSKPHEKARYILLQQIKVQESAEGGFEVLEVKNIASFIHCLIVAQAFIEALKPTSTKGVAE